MAKEVPNIHHLYCAKHIQGNIQLAKFPDTEMFDYFL